MKISGTTSKIRQINAPESENSETTADRKSKTPPSDASARRPDRGKTSGSADAAASDKDIPFPAAAEPRRAATCPSPESAPSPSATALIPTSAGRAAPAAGDKARAGMGSAAPPGVSVGHGSVVGANGIPLLAAADRGPARFIRRTETGAEDDRRRSGSATDNRRGPTPYASSDLRSTSRIFPLEKRMARAG